MTFSAAEIRAIIFDYGNTLVEFGPKQTHFCDNAIAEAVSRLYGPPDLDKLRAIRDRNRLAPYAGNPPEYRENDLREITSDLIRELHELEPSDEDLESVLRARFDAFVNCIDVDGGVRAMLERLHQRYRLGLLSNYPDGESIRASLRKIGVDKHFDAVVVSGDLGRVKPHPLPFSTILRELDSAPSQTVFVGDNWLADIQGAKKSKLWAVLTKQYVPYERFDPRPGDQQPDFVIQRLAELERLLEP